MKLLIILAILSTFSCTSTKNTKVEKQNIENKNAMQNSPVIGFEYVKILPGRPEAKPYLQYTLTLKNPIQVTNITVNEAAKVAFSKSNNESKSTTEYIFTQTDLSENNDFEVFYTENNDEKHIHLPKPTQKETVAMP